MTIRGMLTAKMSGYMAITGLNRRFWLKDTVFAGSGHLFLENWWFSPIARNGNFLYYSYFGEVRSLPMAAGRRSWAVFLRVGHTILVPVSKQLADKFLARWVKFHIMTWPEVSRMMLVYVQAAGFSGR